MTEPAGERAPAATRAGRLIVATLAGGLLIAAGAALPWATARFTGVRLGVGAGPLIGEGAASITGTDLTAVLPAFGIAVTACAVLALLARSRARGALLALAAVAAVGALAVAVPAASAGRIAGRAQEARAEGGFEGRMTISRSPAATVAFAGGVLALVAAALGVRPAASGAGVRMPEAGDAEAPPDEHGEVW